MLLVGGKSGRGVLLRDLSTWRAAWRELRLESDGSPACKHCL